MRSLVLALLIWGLMAMPVQAQEDAGAAACEMRLETALLNLPADRLADTLANWFSLTAEDLGLNGCTLPAVPPETPWCATDEQGNEWCGSPVRLVHAQDEAKAGFCVWVDFSGKIPQGPYMGPGPAAGWQCVDPSSG